MSAPIKDGGSAFPIPESHHANGQVQYGSNGMTLRDYFAGQAMTAIINIVLFQNKPIVLGICCNICNTYFSNFSHKLAPCR